MLYLMYSSKLNQRIYFLNLEKFHCDDGWNQKKNREKLWRYGWVSPSVGTISKRLQLVLISPSSILIDCHFWYWRTATCFATALYVVSPSIQNEHLSSITAKFTNENHLEVPLLVDIVTQLSLRLKICSVTIEMFTKSRKEFTAMRGWKFLGMNRHFVITKPRNMLLFRLQHLSMKLSAPLFHRFGNLYQPQIPISKFCDWTYNRKESILSLLWWATGLILLF